MVFEVNFNPAYLRWIVIGAGVLLLVLFWFTDDMFWASRYKKGRFTGYEYEVEPSAVEGGWNRIVVLLVGIALFALGAAWPWVVGALGVSFVRV